MEAKLIGPRRGDLYGVGGRWLWAHRVGHLWEGDDGVAVLEQEDCVRAFPLDGERLDRGAISKTRAPSPHSSPVEGEDVKIAVS
jgi:hypothetical protein